MRQVVTNKYARNSDTESIEDIERCCACFLSAIQATWHTAIRLKFFTNYCSKQLVERKAIDPVRKPPRSKECPILNSRK